MLKVSQIVAEVISHDDLALSAARRGWLNLSAYARSIKPQVEETLLKDVQESTIVTSLSRITSHTAEPSAHIVKDTIQSLSLHTNLEGMTYERSDIVSASIQEVYHKLNVDNKAFMTITQGINEVTIIAESKIAQQFRVALGNAQKIYDKSDLVGITVKFAPGYLEIPNLIYLLTQRLAYKDINIIEIVSTATELTFFVSKKDMSLSLIQLQRDL